MESILKCFAVGAVAVLAGDKIGNSDAVRAQIAKVPAIGAPLGGVAPFLVGGLVVFGAKKLGLL